LSIQNDVNASSVSTNITADDSLDSKIQDQSINGFLSYDDYMKHFYNSLGAIYDQPENEIVSETDKGSGNYPLNETTSSVEEKSIMANAPNIEKTDILNIGNTFSQTSESQNNTVDILPTEMEGVSQLLNTKVEIIPLMSEPQENNPFQLSAFENQTEEPLFLNESVNSPKETYTPIFPTIGRSTLDKVPSGKLSTQERAEVDLSDTTTKEAMEILPTEKNIRNTLGITTKISEKSDELKEVPLTEHIPTKTVIPQAKEGKEKSYSTDEIDSEKKNRANMVSEAFAKYGEYMADYYKSVYAWSLDGEKLQEALIDKDVPQIDVNVGSYKEYLLNYFKEIRMLRDINQDNLTDNVNPSDHSILQESTLENETRSVPPITLAMIHETSTSMPLMTESEMTTRQNIPESPFSLENNSTLLPSPTSKMFKVSQTSNPVSSVELTGKVILNYINPVYQNELNEYERAEKIVNTESTQSNPVDKNTPTSSLSKTRKISLTTKPVVTVVRIAEKREPSASTKIKETTANSDISLNENVQLTTRPQSYSSPKPTYLDFQELINKSAIVTHANDKSTPFKSSDYFYYDTLLNWRRYNEEIQTWVDKYMAPIMRRKINVHPDINPTVFPGNDSYENVYEEYLKNIEKWEADNYYVLKTMAHDNADKSRPPTKQLTTLSSFPNIATTVRASSTESKNLKDGQPLIQEGNLNDGVSHDEININLPTKNIDKETTPMSLTQESTNINSANSTSISDKQDYLSEPSSEMRTNLDNSPTSNPLNTPIPTTIPVTTFNPYLPKSFKQSTPPSSYLENSEINPSFAISLSQIDSFTTKDVINTIALSQNVAKDETKQIFPTTGIIQKTSPLSLEANVSPRSDGIDEKSKLEEVRIIDATEKTANANNMKIGDINGFEADTSQTSNLPEQVKNYSPAEGQDNLNPSSPDVQQENQIKTNSIEQIIPIVQVIATSKEGEKEDTSLGEKQNSTIYPESTTQSTVIDDQKQNINMNPENQIINIEEKQDVPTYPPTTPEKVDITTAPQTPTQSSSLVKENNIDSNAILSASEYTGSKEESSSLKNAESDKEVQVKDTNQSLNQVNESNHEKSKTQQSILEGIENGNSKASIEAEVSRVNEVSSDVDHNNDTMVTIAPVTENLSEHAKQNEMLTQVQDANATNQIDRDSNEGFTMTPDEKDLASVQISTTKPFDIEDQNKVTASQKMDNETSIVFSIGNPQTENPLYQVSKSPEDKKETLLSTPSNQMTSFSTPPPTTKNIITMTLNPTTIASIKSQEKTAEEMTKSDELFANISGLSTPPYDAWRNDSDDSSDDTADDYPNRRDEEYHDYYYKEEHDSGVGDVESGDDAYNDTNDIKNENGIRSPGYDVPKTPSIDQDKVGSFAWASQSQPIATTSPIRRGFTTKDRDEILPITEVHRRSPVESQRVATTPSLIADLKTLSILDKIIQQEIAEQKLRGNNSSIASGDISATNSSLLTKLVMQPLSNKSGEDGTENYSIEPERMTISNDIIKDDNQKLVTSEAPKTTNLYETATESFLSLLKKKSALTPLKELPSVSTEEVASPYTQRYVSEFHPMTVNPVIKAIAKQLAVNEVLTNRDIDAGKAELPYYNDNDNGAQLGNPVGVPTVANDGFHIDDTRIGTLLDEKATFESKDSDARESKRSEIPDASHSGSGSDKLDELDDEDLMTSQFVSTTPTTFSNKQNNLAESKSLYGGIGSNIHKKNLKSKIEPDKFSLEKNFEPDKEPLEMFKNFSPIIKHQLQRYNGKYRNLVKVKTSIPKHSENE